MDSDLFKFSTTLVKSGGGGGAYYWRDFLFWLTDNLARTIGLWLISENWAPLIGHQADNWAPVE